MGDSAPRVVRADRQSSLKALLACYRGMGETMADLEADSDGIRRASAVSDRLAAEVSADTTGGCCGGGSGQASYVAVQRVRTVLTNVRTKDAARLELYATDLANAAHHYEATDSHAADGISRAL